MRELAPDVVVMDLNMPGISGVEATRQIAMVAPLTRVLVLTISDQDGDVIDAILAGACGYLLKDASIDELIAGINAAAVGESLVSPTIAAKVLQRVRASNASTREAELIRSELSDREIEVLKLIANGKDNAHIAADLHISPKTVKNHISNILMKLQIENRIQAAVVRRPLRSRLANASGVPAKVGEHGAQTPQLARVAVEPPRDRRQLMGLLTCRRVQLPSSSDRRRSRRGARPRARARAHSRP